MRGEVFAEVSAPTKVATVWIDNPERINAMSIHMWRRFVEVLEGLADDQDVRVVAVRGVGGNFCSGADLGEFDDHRQGADTLIYDRRTESALVAVREMAVPVVAFVEGYCLGGGLSIAVACDLVYAVQGARFQIPVAKMGTAYPDGALERLRERVGYAQALAMIATAARLDVSDALRIGLVTEAFDSGEQVVEAIKRIASLAPRSIAAAKAALNGRLSEEERLAIFSSQDYAEGLSAFRERRTPRFRGI
ncbi:MAG: enoyl-CoA hydratase/isomerase family protein [Ferrimicrobium sp.]|uniref:Enoyl-CoA hydratase-related protein n=1 Tax=Ferrimicrobium acidiphilum TaxID=121039 RepID=A0ABV3Y2S2_9ACTN|nr:enoyl-CoA hydratase-related protein [Ferrimicrobium sp.]